MKRSSLRCVGLYLLLALGLAAFAAALETKPAPSADKTSQTASAAIAASNEVSILQSQPENPNSAIGNDLSTASREATESAEHEENAQFKYSPAVRWIAKHLNGDPKLAYFISLFVNFGLFALFFYMLLRSRLPQMFRERTASIQQGIREAEAASADAARRLKQVEAHLAKLDAEVAEIRREAEHNVAEEEARIRKTAEEDKQKVVDAAEAEIAALARNARRELKSYAASLAVDLAARRIHVDERTDHALVREFVDQLGKDGR